MEVMTVMGSERLALIDREIVKRLRLLAGVEKVYRLEGGLYAWIVDQEEEPDPNEIFAAARALFTAPFELDGERLRMSAHFGLTTGSIDGAVLASTHARNRGLIWSSNSEDIQESAAFKQRILSELDDALGNGAMSVVFQPKLRLVDQTIASAECLVRWNSPQLGHIPPADFIPILEGKNRIDDLTRFVLSEAIRHLEIARGKGKHIELAINVSAQLLSDDDFVTFAVGTLEALDRDGDSGITIEITESAPLVDSAKARQALEKLCDAGARISIDDYGTGQATLNYLQGFPAHELKLDQSFVRGLTHDHKDRIMVQSTLELAHALEFEVVAEGVEDQATLDMIAEMGCDYAQGWHIGRPMQWSDLWAMLDENQAVDAAA